ncbi:unnamed protein product [Aphanomyces euteiches]
MAQPGWFKKKSGNARESIIDEMTVVTIDDVDETNPDEDDVEDADAEKSIFDLFGERKYSVIKKRLENIADEDLAAVDGSDYSILDYAVMYTNLDLVKMILERTNYTVIPQYLGAPLFQAAMYNSVEIADYLVKSFGSSLDLDYVNSEGSTTVHTAARYGNNDILEKLLAIGAKADLLNQNNETPLMHAILGYNARGMEVLIQAGANIHLQDQEEKTAAVHQSFGDGIKYLLKAGAEIDIKDNEGKYIIQAAAYDDTKKTLKSERLSRVLYPVHLMARNGDLKALQHWLSVTTAKGPGQSHVWHGQHLHDGDGTDVDLRVTLVRDTESRSYNCVGTFSDEGGVYHVSGEWSGSRLDVKKSYADDESIIEYGGEVDEETGEWKGEYTTGGETAVGEFSSTVPLFQCSKCDSKVPEEKITCFNCDSVEARYWYGDYLEDGQWQSLYMSLEVREDVAAKLYRLTGTGYNNSGESYKLSGTWKDGRINVAKHYAKETVLYNGYFDEETKKWTGELIDSAGGRNEFRFDIPMWPCTECGTDVPNEDSKCLKCRHDSIYNWKGEIREDGEWHDMGLFVAVVRDIENGQYRLIGEGTDDVGDFDAFGTWEGNQITMTKVYPEHTVEFTGNFDESSKIWSGRWIGLEEASDDFRINIPSYTCYKCEAFVPIQNELCLNCSDEIPEWNPRNGSLRHAWVGQCRQERGDWDDDEFSVKVLRDLATDSYRFAGFDKDGAGYFASSGTWKDDDIHMDRIYPTMTAVMDGKYDPVKSEWFGPNIIKYDGGYENKGKMRYSIPMWPCTQCSKPVPIEDSLCFSCDKTPRHTVQPLELPFELDTVRRQIQARVHISNILNQKDRLGRTVIMYAAENGHLGILELLPFMSPDDIRTNDNDGKSALDIALARKLVCAKNPLQLNNDELLDCVELLRRRSCLQIKPTTIPDSFHWPKKCCGDCDKANETTNEKEKEKEVSLYELAKTKQWDELETILHSPLSGEKLNAKDANTGATVAHVVCREGKVKLLKMLLEQSELDLTIYDNEYKYPLYEAMKKDRIGCVQLLLHYGVAPTSLEAYEYQLSLLNKRAKCYQLIVDKYNLMEQDRLRLYYQANVPSIVVAEKHKQAKQSGLHAAILHHQTKNVVDAISQDEIIDIDEKDENGNTALMLVARGKSEFSVDYVKILIAREADIDAINNEKRTALMIATLAGNVEIVELLLKEMAEIDIQDVNGKTCLDLVNQCDLGSSRGSSKTKYATPHAIIKDLLSAEKQSRANSVEFRDKLAKSLVGMTPEEAFSQDGFRKAINCSPSLARTFLDDCVVINRHDIDFSQLKDIYGDDVKTSVLNSIIELKTDDPDFIMEARKECLEHVVMRRVMQIKWEIFGQRKYIEQLMMNMLLLVTSTVSSIIYDGDELKVSSGAVILGIAAVVFTVLSFIFVQFLRPQSLWRIARYLHDGSFTLDPHLEIPDLAVKKGRAKVLLVQIVLFLTAALVVPLLYLMDGLNLVKYFPKFNNGVLWLTVSFFLVTEINEARAGVLKYFKSDINKPK